MPSKVVLGIHVILDPSRKQAAPAQVVEIIRDALRREQGQVRSISGSGITLRQ